MGNGLGQNQEAKSLTVDESDVEGPIIVEAECQCMPNWTCGRQATYTVKNCRCDPCRKANALKVRRARRRRKSSPIPDYVEHGKPSTYSNWGCRKKCCKTAWKKYHQQLGAAKQNEAVA